MQEIWKPIAGYEGLYEISNLGRVKSLARTRRAKGLSTVPVPERIRALSVQREGYVSAHLHLDGKTNKIYVHRLVASAFLDNDAGLPQVNHLDGDKSNNCSSNLEWVTGSENCRHAVDEDLYRAARGEAAGNVTLTDAQVIEIRQMAASGYLHREIAEIFGVGRKNITKIVNRQRWKHIA